MEGWLTLSVIALSTLLALWLSKLSGGKGKPKKPLLPPGPWTLPIIGSLHHAIGALPHRTFKELSRVHGPMMFLQLGEVPAVVVSSAEAVGEIMKANDVAFAHRLITGMQDIYGFGGKGIAFAPYGEHWRQMRKVPIVELLSVKQVKRMDNIRVEEVDGLLASIAASAGATINLSQMVSTLSNELVTRAVFGGKFSQREEYLRAAHQTMNLMGGFFLVDLFPSSQLVRWLTTHESRMKNSCGVMERIIADILVKRKAVRAKGDGTCSTDDEDLLDVLLRLQEDDSLANPLTTEIITAVLLDMFGGGTDTIGTALDWAMSELVTHPEVMAKAQLEVREVLGPNRAIITNNELSELPYMRMVIKEVLRLHPPGPLIPRKAREDCKIMGYDIPKGTNIYINVFAISRDPQYWDNPEEFTPERFENNNVDFSGTCFEFTPFGGGRRGCPGITLASSILEITLANFLYHFDWILPNETTSVSVDMSEKFGLTVRRSSPLQLKAIPHVCSKYKSPI